MGVEANNLKSCQSIFAPFILSEVLCYDIELMKSIVLAVVNKILPDNPCENVLNFSRIVPEYF